MDGTTAVRRVVVGGLEARLAGNAAALAAEMAWLRQVVAARVHELGGGPPATLPEPPLLEPEESPYADLVERLPLDAAGRLVLALALAPHVQPQILDPLFRVNAETSRGHSEVGGLQGRSHGGFLPTAETALFLLAGRDLRARFEAQALLERGHPLTHRGAIQLEDAAVGEPRASGALTVPEETIATVTTGIARRPEFSREFPAQILRTDLEWKDLVLTPSTREELREIEAWTRHEARLRHGHGLGRRLRGGYRALFCGPPGTGKSLTAALLGRRIGREVYRVALSAVVSKYIGETEKNLERVFSRAEGGILFFDEADALFGRRTAVATAHDRYANQEVSYLLQRVEDHRGLIVLASNFEYNIDEAFLRRFHSIVHFPCPGPAERARLWAESLPASLALGRGADLGELAERYELTGAAIVNAVQFAALSALETGTATLRRDDLLAGIRRELQKEGKTL